MGTVDALGRGQGKAGWAPARFRKGVCACARCALLGESNTDLEAERWVRGRAEKRGCAGVRNVNSRCIQ